MDKAQVLKCDFCGALASTKACIINGSKPTVYDKDGKMPRSPAICDECALLVTNMGIRAVKGRLALVESARKAFSMPPSNPLSAVGNEDGEQEKATASPGEPVVPVAPAEE